MSLLDDLERHILDIPKHSDLPEDDLTQDETDGQGWVRVKTTVSQQHSLNKQLQDNFHQLECTKFCPDPANPIRCQCGLSANEHPARCFNEEGKIWTPEACTKSSKLTCFGTITFDEDLSVHDSHYMRVNFNADIKLLVDILKKKWKIPTSNIIFDLCGGVSGRSSLEGVLLELKSCGPILLVVDAVEGEVAGISSRALHAARSQSADLFTSDVTVVGVGYWGSCDECDLLTPPPDWDGHFQAKLDGSGEDGSGSTRLQKGLSAYIFVDDGIRSKDRRCDDFKSKLCKVFSSLGVNGASQIKPPIISLGAIDSDTSEDATSAKDGVGGQSMKVLYSALENYSIKESLVLSRVWNRPALAEKVLRDCNQKLPANLEALFSDSLVGNHVEFVHVFFQFIDQKQFSREKVEQLYVVTLEKKEYSLLKDAILKQDKKKKHSKFTLESICLFLINKYGLPYFLDYRNQSQSQKMSKTKLNRIYHLSAKRKHENLALRNPILDLFIFSSFFGKEDVTLLFWRLSGYDITAGLFVANLLRSYLSVFGNSTSRVKNRTITNIAGNLESRIIVILGSMFDKSWSLTQRLILSPRYCFGNSSFLDLVNKSQSEQFKLRFFELDGSQDLIELIWSGRIDDSNGSNTIIMASLLPPLVKFVHFRMNANEQIKNSNNQDYQKVSNKSIMLRVESSLSPDIIGDNHELPILKKMGYFYQAPVVKFILDSFSKVLFLIIFSFFSLALDTKSINFTEVVLLIWVFSVLVERIFELFYLSHPSIVRRIALFYSDFWNMFDSVGIACYFIAFLIRAITADFTQVSRMCYVLSLGMFFIRGSSMFGFNRHLGPKLVMIEKMVGDLGLFLAVSSVFILGYGVTSVALAHPVTVGEDGGGSGGEWLWGLVLRPAFEMMGEPFMEDVGATEKCTSDGEAVWPHDSCPRQGWTTWVGLCLKLVFMWFSNILLLNMLIALFNNRFNQIHANANLHWRLQRFGMLEEYFNKSPLPAPLSLIHHLVLLIGVLRKRKLAKQHKFRYTVSERKTLMLHRWARAMAEIAMNEES